MSDWNRTVDWEFASTALSQVWECLEVCGCVSWLAIPMKYPVSNDNLRPKCHLVPYVGNRVPFRTQTLSAVSPLLFYMEVRADRSLLRSSVETLRLINMMSCLVFLTNWRCPAIISLRLLHSSSYTTALCSTVTWLWRPGDQNNPEPFNTMLLLLRKRGSSSSH